MSMLSSFPALSVHTWIKLSKWDVKIAVVEKKTSLAEDQDVPRVVFPAFSQQQIFEWLWAKNMFQHHMSFLFLSEIQFNSELTPFNYWHQK